MPKNFILIFRSTTFYGVMHRIIKPWIIYSVLLFSLAASTENDTTKNILMFVAKGYWIFGGKQKLRYFWHVLFMATSFYVTLNIYYIVTTALYIYFLVTHMQLNSVTLGLRSMSYVQQHQFLIYVLFRWIDTYT
jgi:hypothetical protein